MTDLPISLNCIISHSGLDTAEHTPIATSTASLDTTMAEQGQMKAFVLHGLGSTDHIKPQARPLSSLRRGSQSLSQGG